ncbi:MAG: fumarylacetoacetate hydrolase family protein [Betaproteobacteria bacterium]|nr:fumarylacetoacetate hydrolase family protein [Betaproteobacteria bacterium]
MKLLFFDDFRLGVLRGEAVVDVSQAVSDIPRVGPHDVINGLIERFEAYRGRLEDAAASGPGVPVSRVKIRPPLPRPINIDCIAENYLSQVTSSEPALINAFHKSPGAIIGDGDVMVLPDVPASNFEAEAELGVVIGKGAFNVTAAQAMDHVFGYVNFIDGSAKGLLPAKHHHFQVKSRATFAPIGPYLATADEIRDPHAVRVRLWVNGELRQDFSTSGMLYNIPRCIEWVSSIHPLEPGDILATGTNHEGLVSLQDGDRLELEADGLGRLHVSCRDDLKRTWPKETRLERLRRGLPARAEQLTGKYAKPPKD